MYIVFVVLIIIASILIIFAVLAQSPKGGMAANFGVSNQVMGARQTSDFLEKSTWTLAIAVFVLSLLASIAMSSYAPKGSGDKLIDQITTEMEAPASMPGIPVGTDGAEGVTIEETTPAGETPAEEAPAATETAETPAE
jgi:preprotein translocase subunit SecG